MIERLCRNDRSLELIGHCEAGVGGGEMNRAYYNEINPRMAAWLRELITSGLIAEGDVDERSICDVAGDDLQGYTQCHFFAGIGGWSYALKLAGWPDDRPVWTGSCPCQPFSAAGKQLGTADERHLWPEFYRLIRKCRPATIYGEQVASGLALAWLDGVFDNLESSDYACGAADLCAAGVGAPHIRQRLYWVANAERKAGWPASGSGGGDGAAKTGPHAEPGRHGNTGGLEHSTSNGRHSRRAEPDGRVVGGCEFCGYVFDHELFGQYGCPNCNGDGLGDAGSERLEGVGNDESGEVARTTTAPGAGGLGNAKGTRHSQLSSEQQRASADGQYCSDSIITPCRDGKYRRIPASSESILQCLADGLPDYLDASGPDRGFPLCKTVKGRSMLLSGYGNAIVPQVAAAFIRASLQGEMK